MSVSPNSRKLIEKNKKKKQHPNGNHSKNPFTKKKNQFSNLNGSYSNGCDINNNIFSNNINYQTNNSTNNNNINKLSDFHNDIKNIFQLAIVVF